MLDTFPRSQWVQLLCQEYTQFSHLLKWLPYHDNLRYSVFNWHDHNYNTAHQAMKLLIYSWRTFAEETCMWYYINIYLDLATPRNRHSICLAFFLIRFDVWVRSNPWKLFGYFCGEKRLIMHVKWYVFKLWSVWCMCYVFAIWCEMVCCYNGPWLYQQHDYWNTLQTCA